jgi:hypothetical protein
MFMPIPLRWTLARCAVVAGEIAQAQGLREMPVG